MNAKFFDLKQEKQNTIINAGLKVFAKDSFRYASTDDIVKEANISKGLLFHYFSSKVFAYSFLYDYSVRFVMMELESSIASYQSQQGDYFERKIMLEEANYRIAKKYPYMIVFLKRAGYESDTMIRNEIKDKQADLTAFREKSRESLKKTFMNQPQEDTEGYQRLSQRLDDMLDGIVVRYMQLGCMEQIEKLRDERIDAIVWIKKLFQGDCAR